MVERGVTIHVLGALHVDGGGSGPRVELAPKVRALLALLAVNPGAWVTTETLIDGIWPDEVVPSSRKTLQGNVLRLRRALSNDAILTRQASYALNIEVVRVDADEFQLGADLVERLYRSGDLANAIAQARNAEALWDGDAFSDVPDSTTVNAARVRLQERLHQVKAWRLDAMIELGEGRQVIPELESMVAFDPFREDVWALLIRALYAGGRRHDALAAFSRARRVLAVELGLEPGSVLRALEIQVLADASDSLLASANSAESTPSASSTLTATPLLKAYTTKPHQSTDPFVGRTNEVEAALDLVRSVSEGNRRTLIVEGPAGVGKTRFVTEVVTRRSSVFAVRISARNDSVLRRSYGAANEIVIQLDRFDVRGHMDSEANRRLDRVRGFSSTRIEDAASQLALAEPDLERRLTAEAVNHLIVEVARRVGPVAIVIDDIQWADSGTMDVVRELATSRVDVPLLLALTRRSEVRTPTLAEVLHEVDRSGRSTRIALDVLTRSEIRDLILAFLPTGDLDGSTGIDVERRVDDIMARTDGNTLLAHALARAAARQATDLPESVRDLVDAYLRSCSAEAIGMAETGALLGRAFAPEIAWAASEKSARVSDTTSRAAHTPKLPKSTEDMVSELTNVGLVTIAPGDPTTLASFRHDLFRDAALARLTDQQRRSGHSAVLAELERRASTDLDALVMHSVESRSAASAAFRLTQRASRSLASGLVADAIADAESALQWHGRVDDPSVVNEIETMLLLADAQALSAQRNLSEATLRLAIERAELLDGLERVRLSATSLRRLASVMTDGRQTSEALETLLTAVTCIGTDEPEPAELFNEWVEVWLEASSIDYYFNGAVTWAQNALSRIEDAVFRRGTQAQIGNFLEAKTPHAIRAARFRATPDLIEMMTTQLQHSLSHGDAKQIASSLLGVGFFHMSCFDGTSAKHYLQRAVEQHDLIGDRHWGAISRVYVSVAERLLGNYDTVASLAAMATEMGEGIVPPCYLSVLDGNLAWVAWHRSLSAIGAEQTALLDVAAEHSRSAHKRAEHPSVYGAYPFVGFWLWPALAVARERGDVFHLVEYAERLVDQTAQRLPERVEALLRALIDSSGTSNIDEALAWARSVNLA